MRRSRRSRRAACGFSYLWMLILLALLAAGSARLAPLYSTALQREQEQQLLSMGAEMRAAIASYHRRSFPGQAGPADAYPTSLEDLILDSRASPPIRHLRKIHVDPITARRKWGLLKIGNRIVGVRSLSNRSAIKRDEFDGDDYPFAGVERVSEWWFTYPTELGEGDKRRVVDAGSIADYSGNSQKTPSR